MSISTGIIIYFLVGAVIAEGCRYADKKQNNRKMPLVVVLFIAIFWLPLIIAFPLTR